MSQKLYLFGLGGTGSRVIKSLVMLLAGGARLANFDTVIPIIIDPDTANGDLNRTKDILRLYQEIRNQVNEPEDFFYQNMKTVNELAKNDPTINPDFFQFRLSGTDNHTFRDFLGFDTLSEEYKNDTDDKNFIRLLFSQKNLDSKLDVGFKGNPNMGAIVLNQFTNSKDFINFGNTFQPGDAIFIINSIFGGTGAAGFPLLLNHLRGSESLPNRVQIKDSQIGGITFLPYFILNKKSEINHESFEEKAKIALEYYGRTIINQNKINTIYFIGNKGCANVEEYAEGGNEQKNKAHFLELAGALAVFDFCQNIGKLVSNNGRADKTFVKEFGIERDAPNLTFSELNISDANLISIPLTKYRLFTKYLKIGLQKSLGVSRWTKDNIKAVPNRKQSSLNPKYFESINFKNQITPFNEYFDMWLEELEKNKPGFAPFNHINHDNALEIVKSVKPSQDRGFPIVDTTNCEIIEEIRIGGNPDKIHTELIKLFGRSLTEVMKRNKILMR